MNIREKTVIINHPDNSKILATVYQENNSKKMLRTYFAEVIIFPVDNTTFNYSLRIIKKEYHYLNGNSKLQKVDCKIKFADDLVDIIKFIPADIKGNMESQIYA